MTIRLAEKYGSFIMSASDGEELGSEIRAAFADGADVVLDFDGVRAVVSAFLNPALGALYDGADADVIDRRLSIENASDVQARNIADVREHARRFYNDPEFREASKRSVQELFS